VVGVDGGHPPDRVARGFGLLQLGVEAAVLNGCTDVEHADVDTFAGYLGVQGLQVVPLGGLRRTGPLMFGRPCTVLPRRGTPFGAGRAISPRTRVADAGIIARVIVDPAASFAIKPTLAGANVLLRPFAFERDAPALREMLDPEALKLTGSYHDPGEMPEWDAAAEATFRDWYGTRNDQTDRLDLAVVDNASGQCVGEVVFNEWSEANRSCNFRTILGPRGRDRGLGTEAIRLFLSYGFEQLGLHRISLDVLNFNPRAKRVYEKLGFVTEGVLREEHRWGDQWIDVTIMSMLAREWDRHHGRP